MTQNTQWDQLGSDPIHILVVLMNWVQTHYFYLIQSKIVLRLLVTPMLLTFDLIHYHKFNFIGLDDDYDIIPMSNCCT